MEHSQQNPLKRSNKFDFHEQLVAITSDIEFVLESFLNESTQLGRVMKYAVLGGGKRFRAYLCLVTADVYRVERTHSLQVAAAIELIHAYSLIHDDLPAMDDSKLRRGKPSCHVQFGEAASILAGDALIPLAFEALSSEKTHSDSDKRLELISLLSRSIGPQGMPLGQMQDLGLEGNIETIDKLLFLEHLKTGELIACACESGSILGGASDEERQALRIYGQNVGIAFQIVDDILDTTGNSKDLGKPAGRDASQHKATFASLMGKEAAFEMAEKHVQQAIEALSILGNSVETLEQAAHFTLTRLK